MFNSKVCMNLTELYFHLSDYVVSGNVFSGLIGLDIILSCCQAKSHQVSSMTLMSHLRDTTSHIFTHSITLRVQALLAVLLRECLVHTVCVCVCVHACVSVCVCVFVCVCVHERMCLSQPCVYVYMCR